MTIFIAASLISGTLFRPAISVRALHPPLSRLRRQPLRRKGASHSIYLQSGTHHSRTVTETVESTVEGTTDAITSTTTIYTTTVPASTVIVTRGSQTKYKRDDAAAPPRCMTNGVTYPASRITSACSCIDVPAETVSATHVTGTVTVTEVRP